jgi:hypothetical protein
MRFLADPHLFNVMITRARERMIVVTSLPRPGGLVEQYLAYADRPPEAATPLPDPVGWGGALAAQLRELGLPVRPDYEVGSWRVDLCVGAPEVAVAVIGEVHADGVDAHPTRHRTLRRAGWQVHEAFASRWSGDPVRAALELAARHSGVDGPAQGAVFTFPQSVPRA